MLDAIKGALLEEVKAGISIHNEKRKTVIAKKQEGFSAKKGCDQFNHILEFPFEWIRKLTIPPCEGKHFDKWLNVAWPWLGLPTALMIMLNKLPDSWNWLYLVIPAALWSFVMYRL